jgi:predicted aldo/keto reductase-like oxidoreductase
MRVVSVADANRRSAEVAAQIDPLLPDDRKSESLSRKALWIAASTPGVTCVLNGMRTVEYVRDALGIMEWPALEGVEKVYEVVRSE